MVSFDKAINDIAPVINEIVAGDSRREAKLKSEIIQIYNKNRGASPKSIIDSAISLFRLGLQIDPLIGEAYVTTYKTKNGILAQPQIGYKGYIKLATKKGWKIISTPVYAVDKYAFGEDNGVRTFKHRPNLLQRKEGNKQWIEENLLSVVVTAIDPQGFRFVEWVGRDILDKLRGKTATTGGIWEEWTLRMYQAKAIKYALKTLPISDDVTEAIKLDDISDIEAIEQEARPQEARVSKLANLKK